MSKTTPPRLHPDDLQIIVNSIAMTSPDGMKPSRELLRAGMEYQLRRCMILALDAECYDEANICLDALVLLLRGPNADLTVPITADERVAVGS
ncbi:MAG: hypothetical protein OXK79_00715 [Chloroflexota bacterium]|nr:hypothetical protein [Chloroflexota bacterium]